VNKAVLWVFLLTAGLVSGQEFRYGVISDIHIGTETGAVDLRAVVEDINGLAEAERPAFVLVTGDLTEYDFGGELDTAKAILDGLLPPYYAIPGNHELKWSSSGGEAFRRIFGDDRFDFSYGGIRFTGFHQGPVLRMGEGFVSPRDMSFLEASLEQAMIREEAVVLVMHYPLDGTVTNLDEILELLPGHRILHTLHGHGHRNRLSDYSGIAGVMVRSSLARRGPAGYTLVTVGEDSIRFREKNPGLTAGPVWAALARDVETADGAELRADQAGASEETAGGQGDRVYGELSAAEDRQGRSEPVIDENHPAYIWSRDLGEMMTSTAVVSGERVYAATTEGSLIVLDAEDGELLEERVLQSGVYGTPAVQAGGLIRSGRLVLNRVDGTVECFDLKDGHSVWRFETGSSLVSSPLIHGRAVYTGGGDGHVYALRLKDGKELWRWKGHGAYSEAAPVISGNTVIVTAWDETVTALDRKSGKELWRWKGGRSGALYSPAAVTPIVHKGTLFITAPDRFLTAIDLQDGRTLWREDRWPVRENLALGRGARGENVLFAKTMFDTVISVHADGGAYREIWAQSGQYIFDINPAPVTEFRGWLLLPTQFGFVNIHSAETGTMPGRLRLSKNLLHAGQIYRDTAIFTSLDGRITAIRPGPETYFVK